MEEGGGGGGGVSVLHSAPATASNPLTFTARCQKTFQGISAVQEVSQSSST